MMRVSEGLWVLAEEDDSLLELAGREMAEDISKALRGALERLDIEAHKARIYLRIPLRR